MRLVRHGAPGAEKPGLIDKENMVRDLSEVAPTVLDSGLTCANIERLRQFSEANLPIVGANSRIGPCIGRSTKIVCVGLNYRAHIEETGSMATPEPLLFLKATSSISGPHDPIMLPRESEHCDYEAELGVVIGSVTRYVQATDASHVIAGYCIVNDVSERHFQKHRGGQWTKGKSADTFAPIGPWLVTPDEMDDPHALQIELKVNGVTRQRANTSEMIVGVYDLISYISHFMTLLPGDVIATGTPSGVGSGMSPPHFLTAGDVIEISIDKLGTQRQRVVPFDSARSRWFQPL